MPSKRTKRAARTARGRSPASGRRWSHVVTEEGNALDLDRGVFTLSPKQMALSLMRSAERSTRRKSSPFRSAMSMLTFYQNRAGRNLSAGRKQAIQQAKEELRKLYGRTLRGN